MTLAVNTGLGEAAEAGFLYGDLHPHNILFTRDAAGDVHAILPDWDLAVQLNYSAKQTDEPLPYRSVCSFYLSLSGPSLCSTLLA